jgi:hypothetical protein
MNTNIDPDDAIKKIIDFSNQIDALLDIPYNEGRPVKEQLNTRIRAFVRTAFIDDDKKIQDYETDLRSNNRVFVYTEESEETKQKRYQKDLEIMRNHLIGYKDELELLNKSRKKKKHSSSQEIATKNEPKKYTPAQIRLGGIFGIIGSVVFGSIAYTTDSNLVSLALFGVVSLILLVLGVGSIVKPDEFGPTLLLWLENIGKSNSSNQGTGTQQKQKNPKNSPQVINQGNGTVNVHVGTTSRYPDDDEE